MIRRKIMQNFSIDKNIKRNIPNKMTSFIMKRNWNIWSWQSLIITTTIFLLLLMANISECQHNDLPFISQISPKSSSNLDAAGVSYQRSSQLTLESTIVDSGSGTPAHLSQINHDENETRQHLRVERSALPILNENSFPKSGPNDVYFASEKAKEAVAGRYIQYNIKPTGTFDTLSEEPERTERARIGKTLKPAVSAATVLGSTSSAIQSDSFLLKGGLRPLTSGSPLSMNPTSSTATSAAASATIVAHNPRQNANPDIQDIITGIVKLLNGNVNVHANTQGLQQRRPSPSRINNRGPPRISDTQTLPLDYEQQKLPLGSSIRPPPYSGPFDRPERPFITGVPIPEQIVPYRPGFVSNRPPWHRNKPRPPITSTIGGRRPVPQYKPLPASQMSPPPSQVNESPPHKEQQPSSPSTSAESEAIAAPTLTELNDSANDTLKPTDTTYDSEFSNEDINNQYIEVSDQDADAAVSGVSTGTGAVDLLEEEVQPSAAAPAKKEEHSSQKKKPNKHKNNEQKKKHTSTDDYTTLAIETSSVVHSVMQMTSTYAPMPMESGVEDVGIDPSTEEVIFMTPSKTPALETTAVPTKASSKTSSIASSSQSSITTSPLSNTESTHTKSPSRSTELQSTIAPTPSTSAPIPSTTTTTTTTTSTTTTSTTEKMSTNDITTQPPAQPYQPRPGIVLDDPEFKPGGRPRPQRPPQQQQQPPAHIQPTRQHLPPGYGEIFDVTLSAIQGPGSVGGGSQQTINIKPYGSYGSGGGGTGGQQADIIVSASGEDGFVSIDGKRTYINLFGDPTDPPTGVQLQTTPATAIPQLPGGGSGANAVTHSNLGVTGGYGVPETEVVDLKPTKPQSPKPIQAQQPQSPTTLNTGGPTRPHYRTRPTQPPVRIDTCIVGDDSTCDQAQHERCKTENGVSSCHCRPGYSRRKHREPCRKVISFYLGLRVDRIYEHRIVWDNKLVDKSSEPYGQLSYESMRAIDSAMSMTPYSDEFLDAKVNNIYRGDPNLGGSGVFVNMTIKLDESVETLRPNLRSDVQKHLLGVLHRRNNNIGNSVLYVTSPEGAISALHDLDECQSRELNDCHISASCTNSWGSFRCLCAIGLRDPWADQPQRAGRECQSCPESHCNNRGTCSYNDDGNQVCACDGSHYGGQCEIDGEVLGVAIGASVAAVIIIVLTLICLIMWSRRWQREQKNAMGSPVFGYMNTAPLKSAGLPQAGYQVTLEDRMRWAQIADVMSQTNHYGAEPIGPTRPSSAMFAYPNLQAMGMGMGMGTMGGGLSTMQNTMQMHQNGGGGMAPPVPLPRYERLGLNSRSNGMRTLENSSSSEEEDRTDLLGRNFQVPRPKSRSNGSIANQSGIYYDVDYEPSGNGIGNTSVDHLYGSQNHSHMSNSHNHHHIPGPQGIPMSTYTSGRAPSSYYMK